MNMAHQEVQALMERRRALLQALGEVGDMRPGQLTERYRKCGKPNCRCAKPGDPGHGPIWSLTRVVGGKTVTRIIPAGPALERTRAQLEEHKRFRGLTGELVDVSAALCDAGIAAAPKDSGAVKKKPSGMKSAPRSTPK
jgi:hypothetical protein